MTIHRRARVHPNPTRAPTRPAKVMIPTHPPASQTILPTLVRRKMSATVAVADSASQVGAAAQVLASDTVHARAREALIGIEVRKDVCYVLHVCEGLASFSSTLVLTQIVAVDECWSSSNTFYDRQPFKKSHTSATLLRCDSSRRCSPFTNTTKLDGSDGFWLIRIAKLLPSVFSACRYS